MLEVLEPRVYEDLVRRALAEDVGPGDLTTSAVIPGSARAFGRFLAKQACVVCGLDVVREVFAQVDLSLEFETLKSDGDRCGSGDVLATVAGHAASILTAERTALNFLQHLTGIATRTREFVDAAAGEITVLDTRKTVPTLRELAKYAVRCGGGSNHRVGLYDGILIKDNHIRQAGSLAEAVRRVHDSGLALPVEVEAQSLDEVDQAIAARADTIMLDNLDDEQMREAIRRINGHAKIEISGGITLERLTRIRSLGADTVSVGALTHSAPAADISLEFEVA
jgi:nicotinate-nucleotide pyrophosphorylase (carboxylating)